MATVYPHIYYPLYANLTQGYYNNFNSAMQNDSQVRADIWVAEALYVPPGITPTSAWHWNTDWRKYRLNNPNTYSIPAGGTAWSTSFIGRIGENGSTTDLDVSRYTYNTTTKLWESVNVAIILKTPTNPANYARFNYVAFFTSESNTSAYSSNKYPVHSHIGTWQETSAVTLAPGETRTYNFTHKMGWRTRS